MMAIVLTNLETQVQDRIDSLSGSESLEDLLILSKSAEGLDVNRTQLDAAIETKLQSLNATSTLTDLLLSNKAAVLPDNTGSSAIKSIQRGALSVTAPGGTIATISPVNLEKSIVIHSSRGNQSTSTSTGRIISETAVDFRAGVFPTLVEWQVIEYV
jgi:hypothetical protein